MAERGRLWSEGEISTLLDAWSEGRIQAQLLGAVRNEVPFRKIEEELRKAGYDRSYKQCRDKIKALKKRYKDIVDRQRRSGAGCESDDEDVTVPDFKWFAEIHRVMKGRAVISPVQLLDSTNAAPSPTPALRTEQEEEEEGEIELLDASLAPTDSEPPTDGRTATDSGPPMDMRVSSDGRTLSGSRVPTPTPTEAPPKKKRKRLTKLEKADRSANAIIETVMKSQEEARKLTEQLEIERRNWEEKRAEKEAERDDKFLAVLQQLVQVVQPQPVAQHMFGVGYPPPLVPPLPTPIPRPPMPGSSYDPYDQTYVYPSDADEDGGNSELLIQDFLCVGILTYHFILSLHHI